MTTDRRVLIIAGPNGAGKTTFATEFLPNEADCPIFVNADLIAAGLSPFRSFHAGRRNFEDVYRGLVNEWAKYDNSGDVPELLAERSRT